MTSERLAIFAAIVAIALVYAQIALPSLELFHTWQYAAALCILAWVLVTRFSMASLGALIVVAAGLASGLLGPDTLRVARAPGTVAPLPEIGAAAFFSGADADAIARGLTPIVVRRRAHTDIIVTPGSRKFLGALLLTQSPRPAAYIEAFDDRGDHLTITQPGGTSFLSPVLLFRDQQPIAGATHPVDAFALPAVSRAVKTVYFKPEQTAQLRLPPQARGKPAVLFDVFANDQGNSLGIVVATSGEQVDVGGVRLRAILGTYPQLVVASAPHPYALAAGTLLFLVGLGAQAWMRLRASPAS